MWIVKTKGIWLYIPNVSDVGIPTKEKKQIMNKLSLAIQLNNRTKDCPLYYHICSSKKPPKDSLYLLRSLALIIVVISLVQCFEFPSNKNITNIIWINGHITNALPSTFHMNYSSMELVVFEKLPNIKLSRSVSRVTTFFQFDSTKSLLNTLLECTQDLDENIKTFTQNGSEIIMIRKHMTHTNGIDLMHLS